MRRTCVISCGEAASVDAGVRGAAALVPVIGSRMVGAAAAGGSVAGALIVGALAVGTLVVRALVVGALVVGATIVGALVVGGALAAAPVERPAPIAGAIILTRSEEEAQPTPATGWRAALVQHNPKDRGAAREAEASLRRAIAVEPMNPVPRANLAILLLEQSRIDEAAAEIDQALRLDPSFPAARLARGRLRLQTGQPDAALADVVAASAANPSLSNGLLTLAAAYYERGDLGLAMQQLDAADRLDPNDPVIPLARAEIAVDRLDPDVAIAAARESVRRYRLRGGAFSSPAATRDSGSALADSFRLLNFESWARYYGDVVFDPFTASGYFDRALIGGSDLFLNDARFDALAPDEAASVQAYSNLVQGLLLEPLAVASPSRRLQFFREPFVDATLGGGVIATDGGAGWTGNATVQGFDNHPFPVSVFADATFRRDPSLRDNEEFRDLTGTAFVGAEPLPYTRLLAFAAADDRDERLPGSITAPTPLDVSDQTTTLGGIGISRTLGERNVVQALVAASYATFDAALDRSAATPVGPFGVTASTGAEQLSGIAGFSHLIGIGKGDVVYGFEGVAASSEVATRSRTLLPGLPDRIARREQGSDAALGRGFADVILSPTSYLDIEAGVAFLGSTLGSTLVPEADPKIGVAFALTDAHWLRAAATRNTAVAIPVSLVPQATVGLTPFEVPTALGARVDSYALRWDAEWTSRIFTAVEFQHQEVDQLGLTAPLSLVNFQFPDADIDRLQATANVRLGHGFGLTASYAHSWSSVSDDGAPELALEGGKVPYLAHDFARAALTFTHPSRVTATLSETFVGSRIDVSGEHLDDVALTDVGLSWESPDRRVALSVNLFNIFDEPFEVGSDAPGWGRTAALRGEIRF